MHTIREIVHAYEAVSGEKVPKDFSAACLIKACLLLSFPICVPLSRSPEWKFILQMWEEAKQTGSVIYAYHPPIPADQITITAEFSA